MPPRQLQDGITLRGVSFACPGTEREVLTGVVHLPAGRSIAVVGINGAGKTTLVKLLAGLYKPSGGSIEIDGVPLESLDPVAWPERLTGTFQDFMKFEFLARETVGVGDLPSVEDQAAVGRAVTAGARGMLSAHLTTGWRLSWAGSSTASNFLAVSGSGWPWRAVTCAPTRCCSSSTSPPPPSTRCFPHLGKGVGSRLGIACSDGYTALLRLLWAAAGQDTHMPAPITKATPLPFYRSPGSKPR